jgi:drug/metabolite transporter (DMT)-like permease
MNWMAATLASAVLLGCYDLATRHAVRANAVLPVLFLSTLCGATVWIVLLAIQSAVAPCFPAALIVPYLTPSQHGLIMLKSLIVGSSWICTYFAIKHLPVSISSPVRATGPVWTVAGALVVLAERPTWLQDLGMLMTIASFLLLSVAGRAEGVHFHRNKWVGWMLAGTMLGSVSSLYDRFLLGRAGFSPATVQAWFLIYLAVFFLPVAAGWKFRWWARNEFQWRWSIPMIAGFLLVSDFLYFGALREPGALISIVASLRRGNTLVAFAGGILLFGEKSSGTKILAVLGIVTGMVLTML